MTKQIKLGFDKIPNPQTEQLEFLYDINTGIPLRDNRGEILKTNVVLPLGNFTSLKRSTSLVVNNESSDPVLIEEQFAETSEVSTTLLGIPRSEVALGLFSDVSTYGFDSDIWEYFEFNGGPGNQPPEWRNRKNPTYGNRYRPRLDEIPEEQAIALTAFPTPWSFPFGPNFGDVATGGISGYNENLFENYKRFIQLGNTLYDIYHNQLGQNDERFRLFANENFLDPNILIVSDDDVDYAENPTDQFNQIEKWTLAWMDLRDRKLLDPDSNIVSFPDEFDPTNTTPGYSANIIHYSQMESKKAFRYQPGRISGFTFGLRASTDEGSLDNVLEWGCANETDEYMFQIKGSQFNIVRRSTIPLPAKNLERMRLNVNSQVLKPVLNPYRNAFFRNMNATPTPSASPIELYETVISRDFFNGDTLDGNGPSGYVISFEEVTMYKIEFSWYGAVGAKFYAYIPVENDDARWVLIHTLIIENELGEPCLQDPFFRFRFVLGLTNLSSLRYPQYIYKYGSSYFIDGGDDGTTTSHSYQSNIVNISPLQTRSTIGIFPKEVIKNKDGFGVINRKDIIPDNISITTTEPTKIDIIECEGCRGFGHHYAPGLRNTANSQFHDFIINPNGRTISYANSELTFSSADNLKKIIGEGLYSSYVSVTSESEDANIVRRVGAAARINNEIVSSANYANTDFVKMYDNTLKSVKGETFSAKLSGYQVVASDTPLTKENIDINFLTPSPRDQRSFAEFFVGITSKEPEIDLESGELLFDQEDFNINDILFGEYAQYFALKDQNGYDNGESDPRIGNVFSQDPILGNPPGVDSGYCSQARITTSQLQFQTSYSSTNPVTGVTGNYLIFSSATFASLSGLLNGEMGIRTEDGNAFEGSGVTFLQDRAIDYLDNFIIRFYIEISGALPNITEIALRFVNIRGYYINKSKIFNYDLFPLYIVIGLRDNSRVHNITIKEFDDISAFSYIPNWISSQSSNIQVINSGTLNERINASTGLFEAGGLSAEGLPPTNFVDNFRLDSATADTQLQQPLRPGKVHTSIYIGKDQSETFNLNHIFGQDRTTISPGKKNNKAVFFTAKSLDQIGEVEISVTTREQ